MKITIKAEPEEIAKLLRAIASSKEQSEKIESVSTSGAKIAKNEGNKMPSLSDVYPTAFDKPQAIASSEEKTNGKLTSSIFMGPDKPEKMCSSDLYLNL